MHGRESGKSSLHLELGELPLVVWRRKISRTLDFLNSPFYKNPKLKVMGTSRVPRHHHPKSGGASFRPASRAAGLEKTAKKNLPEPSHQKRLKREFESSRVFPDLYYWFHLMMMIGNNNDKRRAMPMTTVLLPKHFFKLRNSNSVKAHTASRRGGVCRVISWKPFNNPLLVLTLSWGRRRQTLSLYCPLFLNVFPTYKRRPWRK